MRFGVLGPLAVWTDAGEPVTIPGAKVRALLADLLVHAGEVLSADRLVDDLWGDRLPRDPINALQAKVSQLRRALDGAEPGARGLVVSRPPGYLLDAGTGTVDASQFDLLVARARDIAAGEPEGSGKLLREALALWRGGALGEFMDAPFAGHAIARLGSSRIAALEDLIESRLSAGEGSGITAELEALVAEHPLRERLRGQHMRALYRAGRQAEALDSYHQLRERLADELGLDPSPELGRLYRAILAHDPDLGAPTPAAARPPTNLPSPVSSLVGREAEVTELRALLRDQRLVTLTGPGGVGKTRVALETARRMAGDHARRRLDLPDGVWVVELGGPRDHCGPDSLMCLAELVAAALGVRDDAVSAATTTDRLAAALRTKRLLLVLDNCEHVVAPAAALADLLLRSAPGLRILATSREPLSLAGELLRPIPPLDVPHTAGDAETVGRSAAVQLFIGRAAAVRPGFALDDGNAAAIATICARLDGLPLAIELAAARVRVLDVHDLAARLDDRFEALGAGPRNAPPRQRTLRAMIDWSFQLLGDPERAVLRRLAVHAGGFTLAAAEAVCATGGVEASDVLDLVAALVDRSMITVSEGGARYLLLETIRAYALERLDAAGETAAARRRHARFFSQLASEADRHLRGPGQRRWLERLDAEAANLRAALDWTIEERDAGLALRLAGVLGWYWYLRGRQAEGRRFFTAALAIDGAQASPERANALAWRCALGAMQPATDWIPHGRDALARYAQLEDPAGLAHAQLLLGGLLWTRGALPEYARLAGEALATYRRLGDRWGLAAALSVHGWVALERGELGVARREGVESRTLFGDLGDAWGLCRAAELLGLVAEIGGEYEHATGEHRTALRLAEDLGLHTVVAHELGRLGRLAALAGDHAQAVDLLERALALARQLSSEPQIAFALVGLGLAARRQGRLDDAEEHLRAVLGWHRDAGFSAGTAFVLAELGFVAELRGDAAASRALHLEGLAAARSTADPRAVALALEGLAGANAAAGDHAHAAGLLGAADAARRSVGAPLPPSERADIDRIAAVARTALGEPAFAAAFRDGAARGLDTPADEAAGERG